MPPTACDTSDLVRDWNRSLRGRIRSQRRQQGSAGFRVEHASRDRRFFTLSPRDEFFRSANSTEVPIETSASRRYRQWTTPYESYIDPPDLVPNWLHAQRFVLAPDCSILYLCSLPSRIPLEDFFPTSEWSHKKKETDRRLLWNGA